MRALRHACNLRRIILFAEHEAEEVPDQEVSDDPIDPDWFTRWRESAQNVSAEQMQRLWARMLSGELRNPGTFSLRTMRFLCDISDREIRAISNIAPLAIKKWIYKNDVDGSNLSTYLEQLLALEECGLLVGVHALSGLQQVISSQNATRFQAILICNEKAVLIENDDSSAALELHMYSVTQVGAELMSLGRFQADMDYLLAMGTDIARKGFTVHICDFEAKRGGQIAIRKSRLLKVDV